MIKSRLSTLLVGGAIVVVLPQAAFALSYEQVGEIAEKITVLMDGYQYGSKVIFRREENTHSVTIPNATTSQPPKQVAAKAPEAYKVAENEAWWNGYWWIGKIVGGVFLVGLIVWKLGYGNWWIGKIVGGVFFIGLSVAIFGSAYILRGISRDDLGDKQGAIADSTQAIKINPNHAYAYNNRGAFRYNLGDKQGAIKDFTQAIKINPNYADAYYNRGLARYDLGDKQGEIADYQKAAELYQQQGKTQDSQKAINKAKALLN